MSAAEALASFAPPPLVPVQKELSAA